MTYLPKKSRKRKNVSTVSFGRRITTSLRPASYGAGGFPLRERIWHSSKCVWTGWDQPPKLRNVQISALPCFGAARTTFKSTNSLFTVQAPLERSNFHSLLTAEASSAAVGRGSGLRVLGT